VPPETLSQTFVYGHVVNEELLRGIGAIPGARLLDVGAGNGTWGPQLRQAGAREIVALDPSADAIAIASEHYDVARVGTLEDTSLAALGGERFDVIIAADVLEHLVDPWRAVRTLRAWAAPEAIFAVSTPNMRFYRLVGNLVLRGDFEYEAYGVRDWTHLRWFTRRSLAAMLAGAGWTPERWIVSRSLKGRLLARASEQLANDFLRQQLMVIARASQTGAGTDGTAASV
jgi:2-polyprenyl-3-methyl-5-hydroxy-6-metoxy-1,4-benzoquinol methylase